MTLEDYMAKMKVAFEGIETKLKQSEKLVTLLERERGMSQGAVNSCDGFSFLFLGWRSR